MFRGFRSRSAQSLVEILIGIALAAIFVVGAATIIAPSLEINRQSTQVQTKTELENEMLDNVKAWAAGNWNDVLALATSSANKYYLNTASSPFTTPTSTQSLQVGSTTYVRYFYLSDVYRDSNDDVTTTASNNNYDPSTKLATVVVQASTTYATPVVTVSEYLTRNESNEINQTNWAGASGQNTPVTIVGTSFSNSSNISISASGSIELLSGGGSCVL